MRIVVPLRAVPPSTLARTMLLAMLVAAGLPTSAAASSSSVKPTAAAAPRLDVNTGASGADHAAIQVVVGAFFRAIRERDQAGFDALFLDGPRTWQPVLSDPALARVRSSKPQARKLRYLAARTPQSMLVSIANDPRSSEERYRGLHIDSDGDLAQVWFDYVFLSDGQATNHGVESWQLVRTEEGWKIISVAWSVNDPDAGRDPGWWRTAADPGSIARP